MSEDFLHGVETLEVSDGARTITTTKMSVIGIVGTAPDADPDKFPLNTPVLVAGNSTEAAYLDTVGDKKGTLPNAVDGIFDQIGAAVTIIRVDEGADEAATMTNLVGGTGVDGNYTGVHALKSAKSVVGYKPRILLVPGYIHQRDEDLPDNPGLFFANPVAAELAGVANQLRAVIIVDGPNTTDDAAVSAIGDFGSSRVYFVDPWVKVYRDGAHVAEPPSSRVAGLIAKMDKEKGFWWSPSNQTLNGITGVARSVDFTMGDPNSRANLLNEQNIATIINEKGYRLWGNRTPCTDPKYAFLCVRRTADAIMDSIQDNHLWAVDRPITRTYGEDVAEGVNNYLRNLKKKGAILGGKCWVNTELTTPDQVAAGKIYWDFDFTPTYPAERMVFRAALINDYIEEVFS